jgi:hypothetical protein
MSYLNRIRLVFFGDFQADVSTVNNDVRHFDNATFETRFQQLSKGPDQNGGWRPHGSSAYRLIHCRVRAAHYEDGTDCTDSRIDPAVGALIGGSDGRVSGKIVDLDPQWQLSSQLWGVEVSLMDSAGNLLFRGRFEPAAFRDILFGRQVGPAVNGQSASAVFQSVLTGVKWGDRHEFSRALRELRRHSSSESLSIRLTTFGYYTRQDQERFTLGAVSGVIGPAYEDEPRSFLAGRRFTPANGKQTSEGVSFFDGRIEGSKSNALVDVSNAIPLIDPFGAQKDVGSLYLAVLSDEGIAEGQPIEDGQVMAVGEIPYRQREWLANTGGLFVASLSEAAKNAALTKPLAILVRNSGGPSKVAIRETRQGFHLRAEQFVQRIDAGQSATVDLYATRYGFPLSNSDVNVVLLPPMSGLGANPEPNPPKASIPDVNTPPESLSFPAALTTDRAGRGALTIKTTDPKNPRAYIDGQIYLLQYSLPQVPDLIQHPFDLVVVHLRNEYGKVDKPTWVEHIAPILTQYGNLYPVMSERIVALTSYDSVASERSILALAFSLDPGDPNHMPVTRDLSAGKRDTILRWLNEKDAQGRYVLRYGTPAPVPAVPIAGRPTVAPAAAIATEVNEELLPEDIGGKVDFLRTLPSSLKSRPSE